MEPYYASIDHLMLPDQLALHIKKNSLILRPLHGHILVLAPARLKLRGDGDGQSRRNRVAANRLPHGVPVVYFFRGPAPGINPQHPPSRIDSRRK